MYISESSPFTPPTQTDRHTKLNLILFFFFGVLSRQLGAQCCPFAVIHAGMTLISSSSSFVLTQFQSDLNHNVNISAKGKKNYQISFSISLTSPKPQPISVMISVVSVFLCRHALQK